MRATSSWLLAGPVLASAAAVELTADGRPAQLGFSPLGDGLCGWVVVYDYVPCMAEPLSLALALPWVTRGVVVVPGLAALHPFRHDCLGGTHRGRDGFRRAGPAGAIG